MWSELVDMIEKRCQDPHQTRHQQARAAMLLHGGLTNCQVAFADYKHHQSDITLANAIAQRKAKRLLSKVEDFF